MRLFGLTFCLAFTYALVFNLHSAQAITFRGILNITYGFQNGNLEQMPLYSLTTAVGRVVRLNFSDVGRPANVSTADKVLVTGRCLKPKTGLKVQTYALICMQATADIKLQGVVNILVTNGSDTNSSRPETIYTLRTQQGVSVTLNFSAVSLPNGLETGDTIAVTGRCWVPGAPFPVQSYRTICKKAGPAISLQGVIQVISVDYTDVDPPYSETSYMLSTGQQKVFLNFPTTAPPKDLRTGDKVQVTAHCWEPGTSFAVETWTTLCKASSPLTSLQGDLIVLAVDYFDAQPPYSETVYSLVSDIDNQFVTLNFSTIGNPTGILNGDRVVVSGRCWSNGTAFPVGSYEVVCKGSEPLLDLQGVISVFHADFTDSDPPYSEQYFTLTTDQGQSVQLSFAAVGEPNNLLSGDRVTITGKCFKAGTKLPVVTYSKIPAQA